MTVELPDGTQAIVQNVITEDPQGVALGLLCQTLLPGFVSSVITLCAYISCFDALLPLILLDPLLPLHVQLMKWRGWPSSWTMAG